MSGKSQLPYFAASAALGFFSGMAKSLTGHNQTIDKAVDTVQGMGAGGIATRTVQDTTKSFTYLEFEYSTPGRAKFGRVLAQVDRGRGVFAKTAAVTLASSKVGEMVGNKVNTYRK